jgi:hypothetical protein
MAKMGRPTDDPKGKRLTIRVASRDLAALQAVAQRDAVGLAEAARRLLRDALGVPGVPPAARSRKKKAGLIK